jgi:hypothetical protein
MPVAAMYGVPAGTGLVAPAGAEGAEGPPQLTQGMPDPSSIDSQKAMYSRELDEQLKQGVEVLAQQLKQQSAYLAAVGEQQKRQYGLQVDQDIKSKEMVLAQQHNEQLLMLQQAAQQQKSALEHQANALILEYQQKKTAEEMAAQHFNFQRQHVEMQQRYAEEMRELQAQQAAAATQVAAQQTAIAQQAAIAQTQAHTMAQQHSQAMLHGAPTAVSFAPATLVPFEQPAPVVAPAATYGPPPTVVTPMAPHPPPAFVQPVVPATLPGGSSMLLQTPQVPMTVMPATSMRM